MGRDTYKVSHPVSNGLPDVQKSPTIIQNLQTPPRQNCQVEKAEVSKKTQMIALKKRAVWQESREEEIEKCRDEKGMGGMGNTKF